VPRSDVISSNEKTVTGRQESGRATVQYIHQQFPPKLIAGGTLELTSPVNVFPVRGFLTFLFQRLGGRPGFNRECQTGRSLHPGLYPHK